MRRAQRTTRPTTPSPARRLTPGLTHRSSSSRALALCPLPTEIPTPDHFSPSSLCPRLTFFSTGNCQRLVALQQVAAQRPASSSGAGPPTSSACHAPPALQITLRRRRRPSGTQFLAGSQHRNFTSNFRIEWGAPPFPGRANNRSAGRRISIGAAPPVTSE